ncbi:MAG: hypothetical protein HC883_05875 [Bdellovibrionaceae bacterium]|nr:hypothetical protein [Pseudobdellovibrionaceae bacterium]
MKKVTEAQICYLEMLRKRGLLDLALAGKLPEEVRRAFVTLAAARYKVPIIKDSYMLRVTTEEKDEADLEIGEYLRHYKLEPNAAYLPLSEPEPRIVQPGKKYHVFRGSYVGHVVKVRGTDEGQWGCKWEANYGNTCCEEYIFRMQKISFLSTERPGSVRTKWAGKS